MANTTIKDNWDKMLIEGNRNEIEFMELVRPYFEDIKHYEDGKQKEADLEIPSLNLRLEVKRDEKSEQTGNFAIEYLCKDKRSGILVTTSHYWIISTKLHHYIFRTKALYTYLVDNKKLWRKVIGGDDNNSKMLLVPRGFVVNQEFCLDLGKNGDNIRQIPYFIV